MAEPSYEELKEWVAELEPKKDLRAFVENNKDKLKLKQK